MSAAQSPPTSAPGGATSLADVYKRLAGELRHFLRGRRGADDAEDLVQDSFVRLLETGRTQEIANPRAWLYRTGANLAADARDHRRVRATVHVDDADVEAVADRRADPARVVEARQQAKQVWAALQTLPEACRHAFLLNRFDGMSQREIALHLGLSEKTVERHVLRALAACQQARTKTDAD